MIRKARYTLLSIFQFTRLTGFEHNRASTSSFGRGHRLWSLNNLWTATLPRMDFCCFVSPPDSPKFERRSINRLACDFGYLEPWSIMKAVPGNINQQMEKWRSWAWNCRWLEPGLKEPLVPNSFGSNWLICGTKCIWVSLKETRRQQMFIFFALPTLAGAPMPSRCGGSCPEPCRPTPTCPEAVPWGLVSLSGLPVLTLMRRKWKTKMEMPNRNNSNTTLPDLEATELYHP